MEIKINQNSVSNKPIGYWNIYYTKCHYSKNGIYGNRIGYYFNDYWQCHYTGDDYNIEIGCERHDNLQYYYNKPGQKFGEQITWK